MNPLTNNSKRRFTTASTNAKINVNPDSRGALRVPVRQVQGGYTVPITYNPNARNPNAR